VQASATCTLSAIVDLVIIETITAAARTDRAIELPVD
jgi:hypothetical protein